MKSMVARPRFLRYPNLASNSDFPAIQMERKGSKRARCLLPRLGHLAAHASGPVKTWRKY
jgi:hypothetical protein